MKLSIIMIIICSIIIVGVIGFSVIYNLIPKRVDTNITANLSSNEDGLIELWHLDEEDGSTTVKDSAPDEFNNVGTIVGDVRFVPRVKGNAADFRSRDSYITFSRLGGDGLKMKDQLTLEGWVYLRSYPAESDGYYMLFGSRQESYDKKLFVRPSGKLEFLTAQTDLDAHGVFLQAPEPLSLNEWHHVAGTLKRISGNEFEKKLFIDAKMVAQALWNIDTGTYLDFSTGFYEVTIGKDFKDNYAAIDGMIDEVAVWSIARESFD